MRLSDPDPVCDHLARDGAPDPGMPQNAFAGSAARQTESRYKAPYHLHSRVQSMESSRQSASHSIGSGCCAQASMHCSCSARQDSTQVSSSCAWEVDHQKVIPRAIKRVPTVNRRFMVFSDSSAYIKSVPIRRHRRGLFTRFKIADPLRDDWNLKSVQAFLGSESVV